MTKATEERLDFQLARFGWFDWDDRFSFQPHEGITDFLPANIPRKSEIVTTYFIRYALVLRIHIHASLRYRN